MSATADTHAGAPPLWQAMLLAAAALEKLDAGVPLDRGLAAATLPATPLHPRAAAAAKDVAYTATRHRALTLACLAQLASRTPDPPVAALLAAALAQLMVARHGAHTVVDQAVRAAKADPRTKEASGFVNGVLRAALRGFDALLAQAQRDEAVRLNLPRWWLQRLRAAYPAAWQRIAQAQLQPPPLVLRVNRRRIPVGDYLAQLAASGIEALQVGSSAVWLRTPRPVEAVPGFAEGLVAVQDAGAQLAAPWLDPRDRMCVLDACAAPGGKTAHLAECADALTIDAVESDPARAQRIEDNLRRLGAHAYARIRVAVADAACPPQYLPRGASLPRYDRILLDAPCTASGIVRRHPDIPWLRRPSDVAKLATQQARLLEALWPLLRPAGRLLYVVCSLFPDEGEQRIEAFLARRGDARLLPLPAAPAPGGPTVQLVPSDLSAVPAWAGSARGAPSLPTVHDGFFYALIEKT